MHAVETSWHLTIDPPLLYDALINFLWSRFCVIYELASFLSWYTGLVLGDAVLTYLSRFISVFYIGHFCGSWYHAAVILPLTDRTWKRCLKSLELKSDKSALTVVLQCNLCKALLSLNRFDVVGWFSEQLSSFRRFSMWVQPTPSSYLSHPFRRLLIICALKGSALPCSAWLHNNKKKNPDHLVSCFSFFSFSWTCLSVC